MKKKLFALLLAGCMVFSMTACGNKEESAETNENAATEENAQVCTLCNYVIVYRIDYVIKTVLVSKKYIKFCRILT